MAEYKEEIKRLEEAWNLVKAEDERKHALIGELFRHVNDLSGKLSEAQMDVRDRKDMLELKRTQLDHAEKQLEDLRRRNDHHAFAMVVIDGDNMPFQDELVKEGLAGGKRTASLLKQAIEEEIKSRFPSLHVQVVVRVYANLKGLSKKYREVLPELASFDDFVRGFNTVDAMCDYIDAGSGKECADEKIKAAFRFCLGDVHCRQIFFGGAADNGYARMLDSYLEDKTTCEQITLLAGPPFAYELAEIKDRFHTVSFEKVFRSQKLPNDVNPRRVSFHITPPGTPMPSQARLDYASAAAKATSGSTPPSPTLQKHFAAETKATFHGSVLRNKFGHRVDSRLSYSQSDYSSIKDRKLCNNFHLLGKCYYLDKYGKCHHEHGDKLNENQLGALRVIARQSPCQNGLSCGQTDCVSGHRCPREPCLIEKCWFPSEMHNVDTVIVNQT